MDDLKTTNKLLMIIVIPVIFYLLKILSFIFVPLILSMFIALLFLPLMRWLKRMKVPKQISILIVVIIIAGLFIGFSELIQISMKEIITNKDVFLEKAEAKFLVPILKIEETLQLDRVEGKNVLIHYLQKNFLSQNFATTFDFIRDTLSMTLMTVFFVVLLLSESINFQKLLSKTIFTRDYSSIKTFMKIEKDIVTFIKVKFVISLFTGVGIGLACLFFDISFPIFWGLFSFAINFIQMIGSVIAVVSLSLFAFVELDPTGILLFFILTIIAIQIIMGSILEPIFMGRSFSINVITILIVLMFWGYLWGIPGLILSIPITVFVKIILEQFPKTKIIASLIAGPDKPIKFKKT
ncbi:MAG: AI-2E family transporter [Marinilabiliales bacterium]|nr:MAG: AI-2E family transporter [Marinilabiliales bacterium]